MPLDTVLSQGAKACPCTREVDRHRAEGDESSTRFTYFALSAKSMLCPKQQNLVRTCVLLTASGEDCKYFPMMPSEGPYMSAELKRSL